MSSAELVQPWDVCGGSSHPSAALFPGTFAALASVCPGVILTQTPLLQSILHGLSMGIRMPHGQHQPAAGANNPQRKRYSPLFRIRAGEGGWLTLLHKPSVTGLPNCAGAALDQRAGCQRGLRDELGLGLEYFRLLLWDALCCTPCMETFLIYSLTLERAGREPQPIKEPGHIQSSFKPLSCTSLLNPPQTQSNKKPGGLLLCPTASPSCCAHPLPMTLSK